MIQITEEFRTRVFEAMISGADEAKQQGTTNRSYATKNGINPSILSRIISGERYMLNPDGSQKLNTSGEPIHILSESKLIEIGHNLSVTLSARKWVAVRNEVFGIVEADMDYCKVGSEIRSIADDCGIGKTFASQYLCARQSNSFHVDCKQADNPTMLVKILAKAIGLDSSGGLSKIKAKVKSALSSVITPLVVLDDIGYVDNKCIRTVLELIDATEGKCGWYLIGDDSLQEKIERSINGKQVGYRALFSRLGKKYTRVVPNGKDAKYAFYRNLLRGVLQANYTGSADVEDLVNRCLASDHADVIGDLRRVRGAVKVFS